MEGRDGAARLRESGSSAGGGGDSLFDSPPPSPPRPCGLSAAGGSASLRRVPSGSIEIPSASPTASLQEDVRLALVGPSSLEAQPLVAEMEREARLTPDDFELLSLVGQGAFGKVGALQSFPSVKPHTAAGVPGEEALQRPRVRHESDAQGPRYGKEPSALELSCSFLVE